jgi:hypothetical protein
MLRDGSVEIKGTNKPVINTKSNENVFKHMEERFTLPPYSKFDYFANITFMEGMMSSLEFESKGMQIACLQNR